MATGIRCFFAAPQDIKCAMFGTPQSPSLAEEAFAGSINGDCEYLQMQAAFQAHLSTLYAEDSPLRVSEQSAKEDTAEAGAAVDADKSTHALRRQAVRTGTHAES